MNKLNLPSRQLSYYQYKAIQDELNGFIIKNWKSVLDEDHFKMAIIDEIAEMLNSVHWKWWKAKTTEPDIWNLKIEVIDILHFAISIYILRDPVIPEGFTFGRTNAKNVLLVNGEFERHLFVSSVARLLSFESPFDMERIVDFLGMTPEEVSAIYVAKAELNYIRQEDGYKNGTYKKVVDGIEDNVKLRSIVDGFIEDKTTTLNEVRKNVRNLFFK